MDVIALHAHGFVYLDERPIVKPGASEQAPAATTRAVFFGRRDIGTMEGEALDLFLALSEVRPDIQPRAPGNDQAGMANDLDTRFITSASPDRRTTSS